MKTSVILFCLPLLFLSIAAWCNLTDGSIRFVDHIDTSGIDFIQVSGDAKNKSLIIEAKGGGIALLDVDGDDLLDIFFVNGSTLQAVAGEPPIDRLYKNNGDGTFTDVTEQAGVGDPEWGMGCAAGDYDNDGDVDLYVTNYGPNRLYRNDGTGRFTDIADSSGCQSILYSTGVSFADYDLDGWLDLVVGDYLELASLDHLPASHKKAEWLGFTVYPGPRAYRPQGMSLFHNRGDATFENVTQTSGIGSAPAAYTFTPVWADVNEDGFPDLYTANDSMPGYLFINNQDGTFTEDGLMAGVAYSEDGTEMAFMGAAFADINNDFHWDLAVTTFSEEPFPVWLGEGDGTFNDVTYVSGIGNKTYPYLGWGVVWMDVDNDGDEDLFFCNGHVYPQADHPDLDTSFAQPPLLFENQGGGKFMQVTQGLGADFYTPRVGRGCASGDLDNDGDLDLVLNNLDGRPSILINEGGNQNHWLQLKLEGTLSNRMAIGAIAKLYAGETQQMKSVFSSSSFLSQNSTILHFGLGKKKKADRIEILWPSGSKTVLTDVEANQRLFILEEVDTSK